MRDGEFIKPWPKACPVQPLGTYEGWYIVRGADGGARILDASKKNWRADILALFRGRESWLFRCWPKANNAGDVYDFDHWLVAEDLIVSASKCGIRNPAEFGFRMIPKLRRRAWR